MKTLIFQNSKKNIVWISALKFFVASWGLPGDLASNIINKSYKVALGRAKDGHFSFFQRSCKIGLRIYGIRVFKN